MQYWETAVATIPPNFSRESYVSAAFHASLTCALLLQVDKLLTEVGGKVVQSIEKDYGNRDGLTTFWNTTMEEVGPLTCLSVLTAVLMSLYGFV